MNRGDAPGEKAAWGGSCQGRRAAGGRGEVEVGWLLKHTDSVLPGCGLIPRGKSVWWIFSARPKHSGLPELVREEGSNKGQSQVWSPGVARLLCEEWPATFS